MPLLLGAALMTRRGTWKDRTSTAGTTVPKVICHPRLCLSRGASQQRRSQLRPEKRSCPTSEKLTSCRYHDAKWKLIADESVRIISEVGARASHRGPRHNAPPDYRGKRQCSVVGRLGGTTFLAAEPSRIFVRISGVLREVDEPRNPNYGPAIAPGNLPAARCPTDSASSSTERSRASMDNNWWATMSSSAWACLANRCTYSPTSAGLPTAE